MQKMTVEGFKLSPQQEHLWLSQQEGGGAPARAVCSVLVEGALDIPTLERAAEMVVARHEILRTSFQRLEGMAAPLQVVGDGARVRIARGGELPGDLDAAAPLSLSLLDTPAGARELVVSLPALCADMLGLRNFVAELARCYAACAGGAGLEDEPMQYADFSEWQHEILTSDETEEGRDFWRRGGAAQEPAELALSPEAAVSRAGVFRPRVISRALGTEVAAGLERLADGAGSSLATSALASFALLLSQLNGSPRLTLGVVFDGRNYEELAPALGLFARTLPVAAGVTPGQTFARLLTELDASLAEAARWQELYAPDASASAPAPPFCFEFVAEAEPTAEATDSLRFTLAKASAYASRFGVLLRCLRRADGSLVAEWHYDEARYSVREMTRTAERWQAAVESVCALGAAARVEDVNVVGPVELDELTRHSRGEVAEWEGVNCLHEFFAAQAARTPEATAVVYESESLTYGELERRANQLARHLRGLGVRAEQRVGLLLERSVEMVVGLLGVLKAGGGYVPLDASLPAERLRAMVADAGVSLVVSVEGLRADAESLGAARVVSLDGDADAIARESGETLESHAAEGNVAYVIYTSGSTGTPKGVMISHRSICNRLLWMLREFPVTAADSVLQKTPYNFDASIWEFFVPLFAGARLVMARPGGHQEADYLVNAVVEHGITTLQLVPSMLRVVLEEPGFERCATLRRVFCGGEALTAKIQEQFFALGRTELHNLYGPTETAIDATFWTFRSDDAQRAVIIGRPISNTQVHLLDEQSRPVPFGVAGELHVGGVNLARGYLNRPALTAEKFIPDPFSAEPGARLYRTGDLARRLADGSVEYVGRIDHQVKLRGFRIELGEVEAALGRHGAVRQAVVTVREDAGERQRLVAYVVATEGAGLTAGELQGHLKTLLPEYMLPSAFVILSELPLLPNGKIDRKSLPAPELARTESGEAYVAPRTATEVTLASVWADVLGVERVSASDNFFELGGDSILSIQIVARANRAGLRLSPRLLFRHQTVIELAAALDEAGVGTEPSVSAEQDVLDGPAPLTPIQSYFFEQELADPHHFNQALLLTLRRRVEPERFQQVLTAAAEHHDALRLRFEPLPEGWSQSYGGRETAGDFAVRVVDVSALEGDERRAAVETECDAAQRSMKLDGGLFRAVLFETGSEQRLLLAAHHLVIDGVSWRILVEDLARGLEQAEGGEPVSLGRKTTSYRAWAERLRDYAAGEASSSELEFWRGVEQSAAARLPVDYPGGGNTIEDGASVEQWLDAEETRALLQDVPKAFRTRINDALLTALAEAVGDWTGRRRVLVEMEGHGREEELFEDVDLSRTVGWFTCVYPVLLDLEGTEDAGAALRSVKESLRRIPHGGVGYGVLRYLRGGAELGGGGDPEVSFNYLGQLDQNADADPLFAGAPESPGALQSGRGLRRYLLELTLAVVGGRLRVQWSYGTRLHARATVERLAAAYVGALRRLVEHCRSEETPGFTASDFSLAGFSDDELAGILDEVEFEGMLGD